MSLWTKQPTNQPTNQPINRPTNKPDPFSIFEKLIVSQLVKKFPTFFETWGFITAFTRKCHQLLYWARSVHSMLRMLFQRMGLSPKLREMFCNVVSFYGKE
jgi:hypothetical protein